MGLIRKTLSISTLGIVDFRSKKEQIRRAEKAQRKAEKQLAGVEGGPRRHRPAPGRGRGARPVGPSGPRPQKAELASRGKVKRRERRRARRRRQRVPSRAS